MHISWADSKQEIVWGPLRVRLCLRARLNSQNLDRKEAVLKSVSMFWFGSQPGLYEKLCISSFLHFDYVVKFYTYDFTIDIPDGAIKMDASEILPRELVFENASSAGSYSSFSNLFRYSLIESRGETWVDSDVYCLTPKLPEDNYLFGFEDDTWINSAVLRLPVGSIASKKLLDEAKRNPNGAVWGTTGPKLLTRILRESGMDSLAKPKEFFYPIHYTDIWRLFDPKELDWTEESLKQAKTLHLWNEILRRGGESLKQNPPPEGSWMHNAFAHHGIPFDGAKISTPMFTSPLRLDFVLNDLDKANLEIDLLKAWWDLRGLRDWLKNLLR